MNKTVLIKILLRDHIDKLPQWYCQLNCFDVPDGFPIRLDKNMSDMEKHSDDAYSMAFSAVCDALGDEGASRAWWTIKLGRTEQQWREMVSSTTHVLTTPSITSNVSGMGHVT